MTDREGKHAADWDSDCATDDSYDFAGRYDKYRTLDKSGFVYGADYSHGRHASEEPQ